MKKIFTLYVALLLIVTINAQQINFCDDFEGYQSGDYIAQSSTSWETWASIMAPCPTTPCADDAQISSMQSTSGNQSLYLNDAVGIGGPADIILPFGSGIPYTTGKFKLTTDLYVTSSAYLNIQAEPYVSNTSLGTVGIWSLNITMDNLGVLTIDGGTNAIVYITSTYPLNQWFEFKIDIDLTQNIWEIYIDTQLIGSFSNTSNKISSLNLYPTTGNDYYIDDICYAYSLFTPLTYDMMAVDLDIASNITLSNAPFTVSGDVVNLSLDTINSLDINYSINGAAPVVDNLSGLSLSLFDTLLFNHNIVWNPLTTGSYLVEIWASNLNGNLDMDTLNDVFSDSIHVWNATTIRQPLIETFTSSTCPPCAPANVTAEALFAQNQNIGKFTSIKYQADFPGAGDPYFTQEGGDRRSYYGITSVPRMEIDGGWDENGNNITQQVLDDYTNIICLMNISATYSINNKTIDVDITVDPLENFNSTNLVVHSAIIEETTYNNTGTNGETQFEHVVKKMLPDNNGTALASLTGGTPSTLSQSYTFNGNYRLPPDASNPINNAIEHSVEDFSKLMVAVWVQDVITKEIHQSTMATLSSVTTESWDCINNACIDPGMGMGTYSTLATCTAVCNVTAVNENSNLSFNIYPNPVKDALTIEGDYTSVNIYDVYGKLVLTTDYQNTIDVTALSNGVYFINITKGDETLIQKITITK